MSRGKRYNGGRQLNVKKVMAVVLTFIAIILFIVGLNKILKADKKNIVSKNVEMGYYSLFSNGNWGIIDSRGNTVIESAYAEMILIPNKTKPVFVCTYDVNYEEGTFKTKVINDKNEEILTDYQNVNVIQNYDENNKLTIESNCLSAQKNGKYGLISLSGSLLLDCQYDSITALRGVENSFIIKKDGKVGLANSNGTIIVPVEYSEVSAVNKDYDNGYIVKNSENKFGVIGSNGNSVLECKYNDIKHLTSNNVYVVNVDGTWQAVNTDGKAFLAGKVNNAVEIANGNIVVNNNGKYGIYNIETDLKIPVDYEYLSHMFDDKYIAKKNGKFGIIDTNNEVLAEFNYKNIEFIKETSYIKAEKNDGKFDYLNRNIELKLSAGNEQVLDGYISVKVDGQTKYYDYNFNEKTNKEVYSTNTLYLISENGKYGYADRDGNVVVKCIYEDAKEQNDFGYCAVKLNGKWGSIDQYGTVTVSPIYEIKGDAPVNFIGKWHVCVDKNANYYTDAE